MYMMYMYMYVSPGNAPITTSADIYSFGICALEVCVCVFVFVQRCTMCLSYMYMYTCTCVYMYYMYVCICIPGICIMCAYAYPVYMCKGKSVYMHVCMLVRTCARVFYEIRSMCTCTHNLQCMFRYMYMGADDRLCPLSLSTDAEP